MPLTVDLGWLSPFISVILFEDSDDRNQCKQLAEKLSKKIMHA